MADKLSLDDCQHLLRQLMANRKILSLATLNNRRQAEASLTPFLYFESCFWVFVSHLSAHTDNLLNRPDMSLLIHADESNAKNPFVVQRLSVQCVANVVTDTRDDVMAGMQQKLGDTVALLRQLPDFRLIRLEPQSGRFIVGFGQAYEIDFSDMSLHHINPSS